jgi:hypothetical protein
MTYCREDINRQKISVSTVTGKLRVYFGVNQYTETRVYYRHILLLVDTLRQRIIFPCQTLRCETVLNVYKEMSTVWYSRE